MIHANLQNKTALLNLWEVANLTIFICLPATGLIQEYFGLVGVTIYFIITPFILIIIQQTERYSQPFIEKWYLILSLLLFLGLILIFAMVYPLETSGKLGIGSDRDEALNIAVDRLLHGDYPYYEKTHLNNVITPLPGAILLALPFAVIGNSAYQNFFWLLIFFFATNSYLKNKASSFTAVVTVLALSPAVQYEFISGGDLLANSLYLLSFLFLVVKLMPQANTAGWVKIGAVILLGVGLASRPNFFLLLPLVFGLMARLAGYKSAIKYTAIICLTLIILILPFFLFDPAAFTPFSAGNKLAQFDTLVPFATLFIGLISGLLSVILAMSSDKKQIYTAFFWKCATVQLCPVICAIILTTITTGFLNFSFMHDRYGLIFLFFGVWGCWPNIVLLCEKPQKSL